MAPPAFVSIGYTVDIGQKNAAAVVTAMAQALDQNVLTFMSPIPGTSEWTVLKDTTILLPDNVTVRRMLTLSTPAALSNGQFPYPTADTVKGCMAALYTGQLEGYCGTPVTELPPVTFDDPVSILGASLNSWWTTVQFGAALAGFASPWDSTAAFAVGFGAQLHSANPFVLGAADGRLNSTLPAVSAGGPQTMGVVVASAQPFSRFVIGVPATAGSAGNWLSGSAGPDSDMIRDGANETFTTDGGANTLVGPPQDGEPHMLGVDADGANSNYWRDGTLWATGNAGAGASTGVTALSDNTGLGGFLPASIAAIVQGIGGAPFTADQWAALFAYAQGRYGIAYGY